MNSVHLPPMTWPKLPLDIAFPYFLTYFAQVGFCTGKMCFEPPVQHAHNKYYHMILIYNLTIVLLHYCLCQLIILLTCYIM